MMIVSASTDDDQLCHLEGAPPPPPPSPLVLITTADYPPLDHEEAKKRIPRNFSITTDCPLLLLLSSTHVHCTHCIFQYFFGKCSSFGGIQPEIHSLNPLLVTHSWPQSN